MDPKLRAKVVACITDLEALLELLKGGQSEEERWRLLEILLGITSRAEFGLVASHVDQMRGAIQQVAVSAKALEKNAKLISKTNVAGV